MSVNRYLSVLAGGPDPEARKKFMTGPCTESQHGEIQLLEWEDAAYLKDGRTGQRAFFTGEDDRLKAREEYRTLAEREDLLEQSRKEAFG